MFTISKQRKQGCMVPNWFSHVIDDRNSIINISLKIPFPFLKKREGAFFDFDSGYFYFNTGLVLVLMLRLRIRKWSFCKVWPGATLVGKIFKIVSINFKHNWKLEKWEYRQSLENQQDGIEDYEYL